MTFNKCLVLASGALCLCFVEVLFATDSFEPNFVPGQEIRVDVNSKLTGIDHFIVYVPSDYNDNQNWPVIFFYHGQGGQPTTWPFKQISGGKGFIVIGMGYVSDNQGPMTEGQYIKYIKRERRSVLEVKRYISQRLRTDDKRLFVTGSSKGGWHTAAILESTPKVWAGAVILAAGRTRAVNTLVTEVGRKALRGKPIYIGAGEKDINLAAAKRAVSYYKNLGARVTFEEYKGAEHAFDPTKPKQLYNWLIANSSIKEVQSGKTDAGGK